MKPAKKLIALAGILLITFPFIYLLLLSFSEDWKFPQILPALYTSQTWNNALRESNGIVGSFFVSMLIASTVAFIATLLGFLLSRVIAIHQKKKILLFVCYFPLALSPVIFALLINYYFIRMGLSGNILGIVIAQLIITLPFSILLLSSFWSQQIRSLEEVCNTMGANFKQTFFKILLPIAKPQLLVCFVQTFLISWFEYGLTTIIGVGKIKTLTLKVYQYIAEANLYYAAISCCIIIFPIVALLWINKRFIYHKPG